MDKGRHRDKDRDWDKVSMGSDVDDVKSKR